MSTGHKIHRRLKALDNICDRGLLAGSIERREAKRLIRDLRELASEVTHAEIEARIESRVDNTLSESDLAYFQTEEWKNRQQRALAEFYASDACKPKITDLEGPL